MRCASFSALRRWGVAFVALFLGWMFPSPSRFFCGGKRTLRTGLVSCRPFRPTFERWSFLVWGGSPPNDSISTSVMRKSSSGTTTASCARQGMTSGAGIGNPINHHERSEHFLHPRPHRTPTHRLQCQRNCSYLRIPRQRSRIFL